VPRHGRPHERRLDCATLQLEDLRVALNDSLRAARATGRRSARAAYGERQARRWALAEILMEPPYLDSAEVSPRSRVHQRRDHPTEHPSHVCSNDQQAQHCPQGPRLPRANIPPHPAVAAARHTGSPCGARRPKGKVAADSASIRPWPVGQTPGPKHEKERGTRHSCGAAHREGPRGQRTGRPHLGVRSTAMADSQDFEARQRQAMNLASYLDKQLPPGSPGPRARQVSYE
jgi:hypothetical protein